MGAYARLARLPAPQLEPVDVGAAGRARRALETRLPGRDRAAAPTSTIEADGDQLEQLLINLIHNAVDAALETHGGVARRLDARQRGHAVRRARRRRRRPGPVEHREPVRPVLHDQAGRLRDRPRAVPPDRRGPRRVAHARESRRRPRLPRRAAAADRPLLRPSRTLTCPRQSATALGREPGTTA